MELPEKIALHFPHVSSLPDNSIVFISIYLFLSVMKLAYAYSFRFVSGKLMQVSSYIMQLFYIHTIKLVTS